MRARLGWALCVATALCTAAETLLVGARRPLLSSATYLDGWPLISFAAVAGALMAALVISRYPRHPIGWLLGVGELGTAAGLCAEAFGSWVPGVDPSRTALGAWGVWVGALLGTQFGVALVSALFLLVPDGRPPSGRSRWVLVAAALGLAMHVGALVGIGPARLQVGGQVDVADWVALLNTGANLVLLGALTAAAVSLGRRTRAARGLARQQLRWIAASAVALAVGLLLALVGLTLVELAGGSSKPVGVVRSLVVTPLFVGYAAVPVCTGIAVLRYRLYDVDVVINRAVVLGMATVLVTGLYVAVVVGLGAVLGSPGGFRRSLVATAIAAGAFQPLRRRVIELANRLAYGSRTAPHEALVAFSSRATTSATSHGVLESVAVAVGTAVAAGHVTAALTVTGAEPLTGEWHAASGRPARQPDGGVQARFDVADAAGELGWVTVRMPPGRTLTAAERRFLHDLTDQAAVGFRNARLEAELAMHLATLNRRTAELERSRRRIIQAQDEERIRLERTIRDRVLPILVPLPAGFEAAADAVREGAVPDVGPLMVRTTEALTALREIGHGLRDDAESAEHARTLADSTGASPPP